jgi:hypothetical protein
MDCALWCRAHRGPVLHDVLHACWCGPALGHALPRAHGKRTCRPGPPTAMLGRVMNRERSRQFPRHLRRKGLLQRCGRRRTPILHPDAPGLRARAVRLGQGLHGLSNLGSLPGLGPRDRPTPSQGRKGQQPSPRAFAFLLLLPAGNGLLLCAAPCCLLRNRGGGRAALFHTYSLWSRTSTLAGANGTEGTSAWRAWAP